MADLVTIWNQALANIGSTVIDNTRAMIIVKFTIAVTGSYATHGDTLSFSGFDDVKSNEPPLFVKIFETPASGTSASGFVYEFIPGTTLANGVVQIFGSGASSGSALTELAAGAYPAGITGASLNCLAYFISL